jgi:RNA polymerase sigma factor (sigma-70 family)
MNELTEQVREAAAKPMGGSGEWGAFERLYRESRDDLYAYLAFLLADHARAEDVLAQAFERAYRKRAKFDARRGELRAWLFGIARNLALDELRRGKRELALDGVALDMPADADAGDTALDRVFVATALHGLEPRDRELVALKFFAGLGNREIARVVGRSETNVGSQLHRAVRKLREVLDA